MLTFFIRQLAKGWWLLVVCASCSSTAFAIDSAPEYLIKAAYIAKLANFITWPESTFSDATANLNLCILGEDPFEINIERAAAQVKPDGRNLVIQRFTELEDSTYCHILYISQSERRRLPNILDFLNRRPVLTVSDNETFVQLGGMVELYRNRRRQVRLAVDLESIQEAELKISAKLLRISRVVRGGQGGKP